MRANTNVESALDALHTALMQCRTQFAHYVRLHRDKGTEEGTAKAQHNQSMVDLIDAAVEGLTPNDAFAKARLERHRQISEEGWTPAHDDQHTDGSLAQAAACYAVPNAGLFWPWGDDGDSRAFKTRPRQLIIAMALLGAELERIERAERTG